MSRHPGRDRRHRQRVASVIPHGARRVFLAWLLAGEDDAVIERAWPGLTPDAQLALVAIVEHYHDSPPPWRGRKW
jgi:hypothetical protein